MVHSGWIDAHRELIDDISSSLSEFDAVDHVSNIRLAWQEAVHTADISSSVSKLHLLLRKQKLRMVNARYSSAIMSRHKHAMQLIYHPL
jgi:hypothetical protein